MLKKVERQYLDVAAAGGPQSELLVHDKNILAYLKTFEWDASRYKFTGVSMVDIVSLIQSTVVGVDDELKKISTTYSERCQNLGAAQRKKQINLATSDFEDFLVPTNIEGLGPIETEYTITLSCVVPAGLEKGNDLSTQFVSRRY